MNKFNLKYFYQNQFVIYISLLITLTILLSFFLYPKTELTFAIFKENLKGLDLDENGKIRNTKYPYYHKLFLLQEKLDLKGIKLNFKSQESLIDEKSPLEFLVSNTSEIDITIYNNYGGTPPETDKYKALSIGSLSVHPVTFLIKSNRTDIKLLKDLKGKKIAFWTSPEGKNKAVFTPDGDQASPYSSDVFQENIFKLAGVTAQNTTLINYWPKQISANDDWDILLDMGYPRKEGSNTYAPNMYDAMLQDKIQFANFEDIEAVNKKLPFTKLIRVPQSLIDLEHNLPHESFTTLGITRSAYVNSHLDPSLIIILCEVLRDIYGDASSFSLKNEYPNFSATEMFKSSSVADKFYREGENSFFRNYFPPILSAFVTKLFFVLAPIFFIIIPLISVLPKSLKKYCQVKINKFYDEIYAIEKMIEQDMDFDVQSLKSRLEALDVKVRNIKFPFLQDEFVQQIFIVREHIVLIQKRLSRINPQ